MRQYWITVSAAMICAVIACSTAATATNPPPQIVDVFVGGQEGYNRSSSASCDMLACGWMRFAIMAFASRQARGRRWRNWWRWRASSSAANSSSSRCLRIRCRNMTVIHRSDRCDKRDTKRHEKSPWMSPGIFLLLPVTRPPLRAGE